MTSYIVRRLLGAIPLLLLISVVTYAMMALAPGGPSAILGPHGPVTGAQHYVTNTNCLRTELADGTTFGLWNSGDTMPFQPASAMLFAVDDFDAAIADVEARGVPIVFRNESPVCWMAMIHDPDGNGIVLHKRKTPA